MDLKEGNPFGSNHFNTIGPYLQKELGYRVVKLSLDAGFTCPNRDGSKGTGGCSFCSEDGSGHYASDIPSQIALLSPKWPQGKYLAYFQSHTNTYAPVSVLRSLFDEALAYPGIIGLAVATRPDCLPDDVLNLLSEYNEKTYLWIELGLQTIHDSTADSLNRCYPLSVFDEAMTKLSARRIRTVVHLILGLPGESPAMMLASAAYVGHLHPFGIKLHLLHVMKNTALEKLYPKEFEVLAQAEYTDLIVDILECLPSDITVHRVTGDAPRQQLVAPLWSADKRSVLNSIQKEFKKRDSWQGKFYSE